MRASTSAGSAAAPDTAMRTLPRSTSSRSGSCAQATYIGGAPTTTLARRSAISRQRLRRIEALRHQQRRAHRHRQAQGHVQGVDVEQRQDGEHHVALAARAGGCPASAAGWRRAGRGSASRPSALPWCPTCTAAARGPVARRRGARDAARRRGPPTGRLTSSALAPPTTRPPAVPRRRPTPRRGRAACCAAPPGPPPAAAPRPPRGPLRRAGSRSSSVGVSVGLSGTATASASRAP